MHLKRLGLALATTGDVPVTERFAIGSLVVEGDDTQPGPDSVLSMLEALAYIGDVLSVAQDQSADESFLETEHRHEDSVVVIRLLNDSRPVVLVIADDEHAFVVVIGSEAGDSTVRFGDGERGRCPPAGLGHVTGTYRHGGGIVGNVELWGLPLSTPFKVIAIHNPGDHQRWMDCLVDS